MASRLFIAVALSVAATLGASCNRGDMSKENVLRGRYEGQWEFVGDEEKLRYWAKGLPRFRLVSQTTAPADLPAWSARADGCLEIDGAVYAFELGCYDSNLARTYPFLAWLRFKADSPPCLLARPRRFRELGISLEIFGADEASDVLYLWFGLNENGTLDGLPFGRR